MRTKLLTTAFLAVVTAFVRGQEPPRIVVEIRADKVFRTVSPLLSGVCIEDVNHEIYGGLWSQMVFGESFQEPAQLPNLKGFRILGGAWRVDQGELNVRGEQGDKIVSDLPAFTDGEVGVEVYVPDKKLTNAGLIVRVGRADGTGADSFDGYEIALNAQKQSLLLGRHQHDFRLLKNVPCEVPTGQWVPLVVKLDGSTLEILVNGKSVLRYDDAPRPLATGTVGLRQWQNQSRYRNLWVKTGGQTHKLPFETIASDPAAVSRMWRPVRIGDAKGTFALESERPFVSKQSQRISLTQGTGEIGVENQGLNRWGMHFIAGKSYEGVVWARSNSPADLFVTIESPDGSQRFAEERIKVKPGDWQQLAFMLTPKMTGSGRLAISLREPGSVVIGYASLEPGDWGRFKGLPVRNDVALAMIDQGNKILRYGGSMVNHPEYRWKNMVGPRDRRPPHRNTWYPYSSNGWGIVDFMDFCEAANFEYVPTFSVDESPQDMIDFLRYAKGPVDSEWGKRRAADSHPQPYKLRILELGNEERIDEAYFKKFKDLAEAIWAQDPNIILVVGDFLYSQPIRDPFKFGGSPSGITTLAAHQKILQLAKQHGREVWFDVHVNTEGPRYDSTIPSTFSFIDALEKLADGAKFKVVVFELNANNHTMRRALANALAIQAIERDGRIPIVTSANGIQPDGQNDNGWDQGLLFLNPSQVWLQPPGHVTRLFSKNYLPKLVESEVRGANDRLDVVAKRSDDGRVLLLQAVNPTDQAVPTEIHLNGFSPKDKAAQVTELSGVLAGKNSATRPSDIVPVSRPWPNDLMNGRAIYVFPPRSITLIRWE